MKVKKGGIMMNKEIVGAICGTTTSAVGTAMQPNQILSTISIVLTIIGSLITIAMALVQWYRKAKADGKITKEELQEGANIIIDGATQIQEEIKKGNKENENKK